MPIGPIPKEEERDRASRPPQPLKQLQQLTRWVQANHRNDRAARQPPGLVEQHRLDPQQCMGDQQGQRFEGSSELRPGSGDRQPKKALAGQEWRVGVESNLPLARQTVGHQRSRRRDGSLDRSQRCLIPLLLEGVEIEEDRQRTGGPWLENFRQELAGPSRRSPVNAARWIARIVVAHRLEAQRVLPERLLGFLVAKGVVERQIKVDERTQLWVDQQIVGRLDVELADRDAERVADGDRRWPGSKSAPLLAANSIALLDALIGPERKERA